MVLRAQNTMISRTSGISQSVDLRDEEATLEGMEVLLRKRSGIGNLHLSNPAWIHQGTFPSISQPILSPDVPRFSETRPIRLVLSPVKAFTSLSRTP